MARSKRSDDVTVRVEPVNLDAPTTIYWMADGSAVQVPAGIRARVRTSAFEVAVTLAFDTELRPRVRELELRATDDASTVTADLLRSIGLAGIEREIIEQAAIRWVPEASRKGAKEASGTAVMRATFDGEPFVFANTGARMVELDQIFKSRRGPKVPDSEVETAANAYRQALASGRRDPLIATAEALHVSRTTAARRVKAARARGLLEGD